MRHEIEIEVRYYETDGQGVVHHANYLQYFELARVQMLRAMGHDYADLERDGMFLVVYSVNCRYHKPAVFGDILRLVIEVVRATHARIDHRYEVYRGDELLVDATTTIACVDREGKIRRIPDLLLGKED